MARGITENEVWTACDALLLEGARPTIERVRQKLGRGSPNTVSPMLETWFRHLGTRIKDPGAFAVPATSPDPVHQAAQHLWEVAQTEARRDLDQRVREGLAEAAANVESEKQRAEISEAAAFSAVSKATHLQADLAALREALDLERSAHAASAARLEESLHRIADLQAELADARQSLDEQRSRADKADAAANDRAAGAERRAAMEIERERTLRTKAEKALAGQTKRVEELAQAQVAITTQAGLVEGRLEQHQIDTARREQDLRAEIERREARIEELETVLATRRAESTARSAQEILMNQLIAKLSPIAAAATQDASVATRRASKSKRSQP